MVVVRPCVRAFVGAALDGANPPVPALHALPRHVLGAVPGRELVHPLGVVRPLVDQHLPPPVPPRLAPRPEAAIRHRSLFVHFEFAQPDQLGDDGDAPLFFCLLLLLRLLTLETSGVWGGSRALSVETRVFANE